MEFTSLFSLLNSDFMFTFSRLGLPSKRSCTKGKKYCVMCVVLYWCPPSQKGGRVEV
jgi:hypothetical protein